MKKESGPSVFSLLAALPPIIMSPTNAIVMFGLEGVVVGVTSDVTVVTVTGAAVVVLSSGLTTCRDAQPTSNNPVKRTWSFFVSNTMSLKWV